jgi:formylglycine-generating enzyme required for sulfatase activity
MVLVPAGQFFMGNGNDAGGQSGAPVYLDAFYIDKFEVTLERYLDFLRATGRELPQ